MSQGIEISNQGSTLRAVYLHNQHEVVSVPVNEIRDASSSAKDEIFQLSAGGFLFSGAFWLGFERFFTVGWRDSLLWISVVCCLCGAILAFFGYRQSLRRVARLERYIPSSSTEG